MATINDLVLVHIDHKPGFYARIEDIMPDAKRGWWQVKLLVLTFPLQVYTWILDDSQVAGADFTMGGTPIRLEKIEAPAARAEELEPVEGDEDTQPAAPRTGAKVVSLRDRKKQD